MHKADNSKITGEKNVSNFICYKSCNVHVFIIHKFIIKANIFTRK
jgi:hypothetical protein